MVGEVMCLYFYYHSYLMEDGMAAWLCGFGRG